MTTTTHHRSSKTWPTVDKQRNARHTRGACRQAHAYNCCKQHTQARLVAGSHTQQHYPTHCAVLQATLHLVAFAHNMHIHNRHHTQRAKVSDTSTCNTLVLMATNNHQLEPAAGWGRQNAAKRCCCTYSKRTGLTDPCCTKSQPRSFAADTRWLLPTGCPINHITSHAPASVSANCCTTS